MSKLGLIAPLLLLTGCCWLCKKPDPIPNPPVIEAKVQSLDSHLAAIIGVTSENADKPDVVRSELKVASAYLPLRSEEHTSELQSH